MERRSLPELKELIEVTLDESGNFTFGWRGGRFSDKIRDIRSTDPRCGGREF